MTFSRHIPRTLLAMLLLLALPALAVAQDDGGETEDNPVVVRYGDDVERLDAFETRFEIALRNLAASQGVELTPEVRAQLAPLQAQFLDQRATELALLSEAQERGFEVDASAVDDEVAQARENVPEGRTFDDLLEESGIGSEETLRQLIGENQLINQVVNALREEIEVADADVEAAYEERQEEFTTPEQVCARHILLENEEDAQEVLTELEEGADFAELARERSTGPSAEQGGDLGCFGREQMVAPFAEAAFEAEVGTPVGPVETQFGQHVILVEERREAGVAPLEEVRDEVEQQLVNQRLQEEIDTLQDEAEVETFPDRLPEPELPEGAPVPAPESPEGGEAAPEGEEQDGGDAAPEGDAEEGEPEGE